ncbi:glycosyltransferase family 4 protein [Cellulomonas cellasea]|uniref:Glycosyltransferase involved in cell wall biosynthesis n=1 Tax=Cellulomonas cellasea TaxID=43670 RepID=A0A7W4UDH7_9CELL|nr:glycosyltransferase family 4 protein [Cellulomonas cellasea]MBB2922186.1 glycosyltransferase involved in cell wall biosynthesis [Cellulomonas cellasea]
MSRRVVQVLGSSAGGVARHVGQIASALSAADGGLDGLQVQVVGPAAVEATVLPGTDTGTGAAAFRAVEITDRPRPADVRAVLELRRLVRGAGVLHAHGLRAGALAVLAARTLPRGVRPRSVVTLHNLPVGGRAVRVVSGVLELVVARGADVVLGVSGDLVARAGARGARRAERALVPAPTTPPPGRSREDVRADLGVPDGAALAVTVARLAPQKGLDALLDAAGLLPAAPPLVWVVAGDGPLESALAARVRAEALPVRLLGRRHDVPDLLAAADVVVSTAVWEGQPIAVQEALRVGAAVVATDAGGTREVTGDAAVLVPVGSAERLAEAVRAVLTDDGRREDLRAAASARSAELPDVAQVVAQLLRVYGFDPGGSDGGAGHRPPGPRR